MANAQLTGSVAVIALAAIAALFMPGEKLGELANIDTAGNPAVQQELAALKSNLDQERQTMDREREQRMKQQQEEEATRKQNHIEVEAERERAREKELAAAAEAARKAEGEKSHESVKTAAAHTSELKKPKEEGGKTTMQEKLPKWLQDSLGQLQREGFAHVILAAFGMSRANTPPTKAPPARKGSAKKLTGTPPPKPITPTTSASSSPALVRKSPAAGEDPVAPEPEKREEKSEAKSEEKIEKKREEPVVPEPEKREERISQDEKREEPAATAAPAPAPVRSASFTAPTVTTSAAAENNVVAAATPAPAPAPARSDSSLVAPPPTKQQPTVSQVAERDDRSADAPAVAAETSTQAVVTVPTVVAETEHAAPTHTNPANPHTETAAAAQPEAASEAVVAAPGKAEEPAEAHNTNGKVGELPEIKQNGHAGAETAAAEAGGQEEF